MVEYTQLVRQSVTRDGASSPQSNIYSYLRKWALTLTSVLAISYIRLWVLSSDIRENILGLKIFYSSMIMIMFLFMFISMFMNLDVFMDIDMEKKTDRLGHGQGHGNKDGHSTIWISDTGFLYI